MFRFHNYLFKRLFNGFLDLAPILVVILIFQIFIVQQPIPDLSKLITGIFFVILGLSLFIQGLEQGLFPIGESMAFAFARKGSVIWLLIFAFCLGFGSSIAEPALIGIADQAALIASQAKIIAVTEQAKHEYALGLRISVALAVGFSILVGVLRIIRGWPVHYLMLLGYIAIGIMTPFAPREIVGIAYDSGGVATSVITVPLVAALGVGLASVIKGRNPLLDGFGLIAFASLMPTIFVMAYGLIL